MVINKFSYTEVKDRNPCSNCLFFNRILRLYTKGNWKVTPDLQEVYPGIARAAPITKKGKRYAYEPKLLPIY